MSRILRRPMFRGGPASSEGVGITSGLDTPKRGLVDGPGGYAGDLDAILKQQKDIYEQQQNYVQPKTSEDILKKYNKDIAAYDLSFMDPDSSGTGGYAQDLANTYYAKSTPEYKKKYLELEEAKSAQQKLIGEKLGFKFDPTLYGKNIVDNKKNNLLDNSQVDENNVKQKYTLPTLEQDIDSYSKLLLDKAGSDKDEYTRQKYLTLAKFGFNLLKPTPAGIKPSLLSSIATAAEKPLEEYGNISMQESKEGRASRQLAAQLAFQKHMPGNMAKSVQDLMSVNPKMTVEEAISVVTTGKNKAALQKEQMLEVENKKKEIEDLATKDPSLKKLSKIDPSFINTYSQIAVEQGLYGHELKGLAGDYTVFQPGSIYYAPDKQTGQLLPHKFIKGKLYSIREPEFKQKGI